MTLKTVAVIMAGGKGERFWPKSRSRLPKPFLCITDEKKTMIQQTADRLIPFIPAEDIFVVTGKEHVNLVKEQLSWLKEENILAEPMGKNTAACIGYAASIIEKRYGEAISITVPADHLIQNEERYRKILQQAVAAADSDAIITVGIIPLSPDTGYGYIKYETVTESDLLPVSRFTEKPDGETACLYLQEGHYLWNSGIFIYKNSVVMKSFIKLMPEIAIMMEKVSKCSNEEVNQVLTETYMTLQPISFDKGIMEKADKVYTIRGDFGWDDIGTWKALERIGKADDNDNVITGNVMTESTHHSIIQGKDKLMAVVGMSEVIIVETEEVILVCHKNNIQEINEVIRKIKENKREELL